MIKYMSVQLACKFSRMKHLDRWAFEMGTSRDKSRDLAPSNDSAAGGKRAFALQRARWSKPYLIDGKHMSYGGADGTG